MLSLRNLLKLKLNNYLFKNNELKKTICTECEPNNIYGKVCIKQVIHYNKENNCLDLIELNPCVECVNFRKNKKIKINQSNIFPIGKCNLFRMINTKENLDTITSRMYYDLCGPCGKYFSSRLEKIK